MDNRNQNRSALTIFRFQSSNVPHRVYANGLQRVSLHIEIRKVAADNWTNVDLSAQELNSLTLVRADGLPMGNWSTFSERGRTDILLGESTNFQASFSEELASEAEEEMASPAAFQLITRYLSSNQVIVTSFIAEIKLDDHNEVIRIPMGQSLVCEAIRPKPVMARDLETSFETKFDEKSGSSAQSWWSVNVLYVRFPQNAPVMLQEADFGIPTGGGVIHLNRVFLMNIHAYDRRISDGVLRRDITHLTTNDIRRGFANAHERPRDIWLRSAQIWPIRLILYYDNMMSQRHRETPITYTFLDLHGTTHRYRVSTERHGRFDILDDHPFS